MIYLDYSATTKASSEVLNKFIEIENNYFGNPNSNHKLGKEAKNKINDSIKNICSHFLNRLLYPSLQDNSYIFHQEVHLS